MKVDMTNLFRVRRDGSGDIALFEIPYSTRLTRGEALNLAVWLVAFADGKATFWEQRIRSHGASALNPRKLGSIAGPKTTG